MLLRRIAGVLIWFGLGLAACTAVGSGVPNLPTPIALATVPIVRSTPTLQQIVSTSTLTPMTAVAVTPTPISDTGWELLRPGLERRVIRLVDEAERPLERLYVVRLQPELYRVTIAYRPGEAQSMAAWQEETRALLLVNGGFFTAEMVATGRIVVDGVGSGVSYKGFGGMLVVAADSADSVESVSVRSLEERPYDPNELLAYGVQSFPLLVKPGGEIGYPEEDGQQARRTVVGMDGDGRLLFILAPNGTFTLHELSRYLLASDLALEIALNLDGGTSTGLRLAEPAEEIPAFVPLPAVIAIYSRFDE